MNLYQKSGYKIETLFLFTMNAQKNYHFLNENVLETLCFPAQNFEFWFNEQSRRNKSKVK